MDRDSSKRTPVALPCADVAVAEEEDSDAFTNAIGRLT